jgi:hypothetical protein
MTGVERLLVAVTMVKEIVTAAIMKEGIMEMLSALQY